MTLKYWIMATRPKTLFAGVTPVLIGLVLAETINLKLATITILCTLLLQISSNLINDYYDGIQKKDGPNRLGPKRVVANGYLQAKSIKYGFILTLTMAFIFGLFLIYHAGTPIIIIGLSSIICAYLYTGGPLPLSDIGLGEVFAFIFFGPIAVWGTTFIQTNNFEFDYALFGVMPGLLSAAIMAINNLRDIEQDTKVGKTTVAVLVGEKKARKLVFLLIFFALISPFFVTFKYIYLLHFLTLLIWKKEVNTILSQPISSRLNETLANTGKLLFINGLLFIILYSQKV